MSKIYIKDVFFSVDDESDYIEVVTNHGTVVKRGDEWSGAVFDCEVVFNEEISLELEKAFDNYFSKKED